MLSVGNVRVCQTASILRSYNNLNISNSKNIGFRNNFAEFDPFKF